jgi:glutamate-1-semialdehyde 2,1-aminomutase
VTDVDGVERLDAINNFTALIHGHAFSPLVDAVSRQLARGTAFSAPTPEEVALAELLVERVPGLERIRFGNSGTEAVMMTIKAARAYTGRDRIAKFEGAYHGYYDDVQVSFSSRPDDWGPDDAPASVPSSGGVPKHRVLETLVLPWNDRDACERLVTRHASELAAVLDQAAEARMERLFRALLDAGVLLHTTGLGCLSTPMGDREVEEIAAAAERALGVVGRG